LACIAPRKQAPRKISLIPPVVLQDERRAVPLSPTDATASCIEDFPLVFRRHVRARSGSAKQARIA
jgi:hypothetical protein